MSSTRRYSQAGFKEGKVPPSVLKSLVFQKLGYSDPSVLVGPSLGIDGAVVDTPKAPIVLSTDPITGASEDLGRLIVNINANDIAVMGAKPRYAQVFYEYEAEVLASCAWLIFEFCSYKMM